MDKITHIVFSGGGLRGIMYLGILRYIYVEKLNNNIHNIAGTSMGSLFALMFSLKIPIEHIEDIIKNTIHDNDIMFTNKDKYLDLFSENGIIDSTNVIKHLKNYIKDRHNIDDLTFLELSKKTGINLFVNASNINKNKNIIFGIETTPNVSVFDAVSASFSIPLIFKPVKIEEEYYVDGGMINHFIINVFKSVPNENILGIIIKIKKDYTVDDIPKNNIIPFYDYLIRIILFIKSGWDENTMCNYNDSNKNTIIVTESNLDITIPYEINKEGLLIVIKPDDIDKLIIQGYTIMHNYNKSC